MELDLIDKLKELKIVSLQVTPNLQYNPQIDRVEATVSYKSKNGGIQYMRISDSTVNALLEKVKKLINCLDEMEPET